MIMCRVPEKQIEKDLEVPSDIGVHELANALFEAFMPEKDFSDMRNCFLRMEHPIRLLRGEGTLKESGVRNGSVIYIV